MEPFLNQLVKLLIPVIFIFLSGCDSGNPTEPAAIFAIDIVKPKVEFDTYNINEGQSVNIKINFDRKTKVRSFVNWEIRGGIGRFLKPTGVVQVNAGADYVEVPLESYRNETIDPDTSFEVVFNSDSFELAATAMINMTDLTAPASIQLNPTTELNLPAAAVGVQVSGSITLTNSGGISARALTPSVFADAQMYFLGGVYPGTGGTCTAVLAAGASCNVVVAANMSAPGSLSQNLSFSYTNGVSTQVTSLTVKAAADSVIATLSGMPTGQSKTKILNITVGGFGIDSYRYKVGTSAIDCASGVGYSGAPVPVATKITNDISALPDGFIKVCVTGIKAGDEQSQSAATVATWFKDTTPPDIIGSGISINNGLTHTNTLSTTLRMTTNGAQFMYVTNSSGCSAGGTWEIYNQTKTWNLSFSNSNNRVYVKFRDPLGNETACINASIIHDNTPATVIINQDLAQPDPTLSLPVTFVATFSENMNASTFSTQAVEQTGTAGGVEWVVTPISSTQFRVEAVAATSGGSIIPAIKSGIVMDLAENTSLGSTSVDASVSYSLIEFYFKSMALGDQQSCGLSNDGKAYCWGSNSNFQLGIGPAVSPPTQSVIPASVDLSMAAGQQFIKLSTGSTSSCGLMASGKIYCWGTTANAANGQPVGTNQKVPKEIAHYFNAGHPSNCGGWYTVSDYTDVSVGKTHVCGIEKSGYINCFGQMPIFHSAPTEPYRCINPVNRYVGGKLPKSISSGDFGACVLNADNKIYCAGRNTVGQIGDGTTTNRASWTAVNISGLTNFPGFKQVSSGGEHACAVSQKGKVYCWGQGTEGQLGTGSFTNRTVPTLIDTTSLGDIIFDEVKAGSRHTCARSIQGRIYCWGEGANGKLGHTDLTNQNTPVLVLASVGQFTNVVGLEVGYNHSCGLTSEGKLFCWGAQSTEGRLGSNSAADQDRPVAVEISHLLSKRTFTQISSGSDNTCAIGSDGKPYCWGKGSTGKLGNGATDKLIPIAVNLTGIPGTQFTQISTGTNHTCGLTTEGKIFCWGQNNEGQLGNGTNVASTVPVEIDTNIVGLNDPGTVDNEFIGFKSVHVGHSHTCALYGNNKIYCWGYGLYGQLGSNSTLSQPRPQAVVEPGGGFIAFKELAVGDYHTCALSTDHKAYCWGWGSLGRLGNGTTDNKYAPTLVDTSLNADITSRTQEHFEKITLGADHTCMSTIGNSLYCWGSGLDGRLGVDDNTTRLYPMTAVMTQVTENSGIAQIEAGKEHTCLTTRLGQVSCWGVGLKGRVGDGYFLDRAVPVRTDFSTSTGYVGAYAITSGGSHTCALGFTGEQYCWGEGLNGRLGNNSTLVDKGVPVNVLFP